jgi:hypothetical protein
MNIPTHTELLHRKFVNINDQTLLVNCCAALYRYQLPFAGKNAPPFSANHQSENPFSRFLLCSKFLLFLNQYANYSYQRI